MHAHRSPHSIAQTLSRRVFLAFAVAGIVFPLLSSGCGRHAQECAAVHRATPSDRAMEDQADAAFVTQRGGRNRTVEFTERFHAMQDGTATISPAAFAGCDLILVHGWLGEVALKLTHFLDRFNSDQRALDYFKDQQFAAEELGFCVSAPAYRSQYVATCGEKLARQIACNPRPVILISHSKGSLDTLEALLCLQREGNLSKVAGWISIQGPLYGSPQADDFVQRPLHFFGTRLKVRMLGAKLSAVVDMTTCERSAYMTRHQAEIETLLQKVPVLCFASWYEPACANGLLSDADVPTESAILPGCDYVAKSGISHAITVIGRKPQAYDRLTMTKTLLAMLGEKMTPTTVK